MKTDLKEQMNGIQPIFIILKNVAYRSFFILGKWYN